MCFLEQELRGARGQPSHVVRSPGQTLATVACKFSNSQILRFFVFSIENPKTLHTRLFDLARRLCQKSRFGIHAPLSGLSGIGLELWNLNSGLWPELGSQNMLLC